jgi:hypothetical protein
MAGGPCICYAARRKSSMIGVQESLFSLAGNT